MKSTALRRLLEQSDLLAAVGVVMVVTMLVVPLPPALLDLLITLNISAALTVVATTMYLGKALDFASFPSLLLLTTMFRLAINVSVTRLILTTGSAGSVVQSFGAFVVGGNVVVGLVDLPDPRRDPVRRRHERRRAGRRGRGSLHARRDAGQADGDRRGPQRRSDHRRPGARPPIGDRSRGRLLRRDGRRLEVRQRRRDGRPDHHRHQPGRRDHRRDAAARAGLRRSHPAVLAADGRRRPRRADPRAADLGRDGDHRHPCGVRPRPRLGHRGTDPAPAQGAAGRRRGDRRLRPDPRAPEAALHRDRRDLRRDRLGRPQRTARGSRAGRERRPPRCPARATSRSRRSGSTRWSWRSASASCRSWTATPAERCCDV